MSVQLGQLGKRKETRIFILLWPQLRDLLERWQRWASPRPVGLKRFEMRMALTSNIHKHPLKRTAVIYRDST